MRNSGYNEAFRQQVINAGVLSHRDDAERSVSGGKKLFRTRKDRRSRNSSRLETAWWKKTRHGEEVPVTYIKVAYTPGSRLLKEFQSVARKHNFPIRFVELSGYSLQNILERSDPFRGKTCGRPDCFPCISGGGGNCQNIGPAYQITCHEEECVARGVRYDGESGRSAYSRLKDHVQGYRNKDKNNVLWKHAVSDHDGRLDVDYRARVLKTYGPDNATRKTNEALRISGNTGVRLNSKAEYRQPTVPRLVIQGNRNE